MWFSRLGKRESTQVPAPISVPPTGKFDGNDGPWSSFPIQVGTPPQTVSVLVSTASSQIWTVNPQGCTTSDPANCSTARGGFFVPGNSSSWSQNQDVASGLYPIPLEWQINVTETGLYGKDTVTLAGQGSNKATLDDQVVASIAGKGYYTGYLGLNPQSVTLPQTSNEIQSFISGLNSSTLIPSLSWGYTAGNQYRPGPVYGSLTLGGYDTSRFEPNDLSFPINTTDPRGLMVNIWGMTLTTHNDEPLDLSTAGESTPAFIDSTTPYIILPTNVCEQFEMEFELTWDENVQAYLINDTLHEYLLSGNTLVNFTLGTPMTAPDQRVNVTLPYSAFDLIAEAPLFNNGSRYFPLMRASNASEVTLGRTFLQEA